MKGFREEVTFNWATEGWWDYVIFHSSLINSTTTTRKDPHCLFMPKVSTSESLEIRENNVWVSNTINSKVYSLSGFLNYQQPLRTLVLTQRMTPVTGSFQEVDCPPYTQVKRPLLWGC